MTQTFDPTSHAIAPPRRFEDLAVGERFNAPSRTLTDAHFAAFQVLSGDNHPVHYDRPYLAARGHRDLLAHGLQVLCFTAAGAGLFPAAIGEALIGFVELTAKFKVPVYVGDTLYPSLVIADLIPQNTTGIVAMAATVHNQNGALVLEGTHKYLLRLAT